MPSSVHGEKNDQHLQYKAIYAIMVYVTLFQKSILGGFFMKRRVKLLFGRFLQIGSLILGAYFIFYLFGYIPVSKIIIAFKEGGALSIIWETLCQITILLFGFWCSLLGAVIVFNIGCKIVVDNRKLSANKDEYEYRGF